MRNDINCVGTLHFLGPVESANEHLVPCIALILESISLQWKHAQPKNGTSNDSRSVTLNRMKTLKLLALRVFVWL